MRMVVAAARACPLCNGRRGRRVWSEGGYRYLRCAICHLVWADIAADDYAAQRHNAWDEREVSAATEDFYGRARKRAHDEFLERVGPPPGRLLDVGCGLGYFLARAQERGWSVRGCDTSEAWVHITNERLGRGAASVGQLHDAIAPEERFDLITAWDVIEHVHDPISFLRELASRLALNGTVFLRTPNLAYVLPVYALRRLVGDAVDLGVTNHVVYFTASTMRHALRHAGLEAVRWPVLPPPQVESFAGPGAAPGAVVRLKNGYAAIADRLAAISRGRVVVGSDLDVVAVRARGHAPTSAATPGGDLTIVVPCLDEHELLERFLRSVCAVLPGAEVVVVDMGGWTPRAELRECLALRVLRTEPRSIAAAKNLGLRYATRRYVALMDSDNVLLGDGEEWRTVLADGFATGADLITLGRREDARRLATGVTPTKWNFSRHTIGWSVIWRREHLLRLGGFDERFGTSTLAGCGEDFRPLYEHFADPRATTTSLVGLQVGHPSLQKPVSPARLYRYTYGSAISTLLPLRHGVSPMAAFWTAKTVAGFGADLVRGLRRADLGWLAVVLRARARAMADAATLGAPRKLAEPAGRMQD